jgi:predicted lactoylglutathione lyase
MVWVFKPMRKGTIPTWSFQDLRHKLARKAGATIAKEPQKVFWGGYHAYFADPDGYYWEVAYTPYWSFDEKDMVVLQSEED